MKNLFDDLASSAFAFGLAGRFTEHRVRVLAYHAIGDGEKFAAQMNEIRRSFRPISSDDLLRALEGNADVPERSIWITFDDGDTSVIDIALPTLIALGLPSTLFVCPGVVNSREPYWWQIVEESVRRRVEPEHWRLGHDSAAAIRILKELPDTDRRRIVDSVRAVLERTSSQPYEEQQITDDQLRHYIRNGGSVGNHTWDHPCLDTCSPEEQDKQIKLAHDWLQANLGINSMVFAYPNGNYTKHAAGILADLGYGAAVLFDHKLTRLGEDRFRLSRLRVGTHNSDGRFRAIVSGLHPAGQQLRELLFRHKGDQSPL